VWSLVSTLFETDPLLREVNHYENLEVGMGLEPITRLRPTAYQHSDQLY